MPAKLDLIGIIVQDIPAAMDSEGHVEHVLPNGLRVAWDTHETIRSFDDHWEPATGGHRLGLAFLCDTPAEVDELFGRLTGLGYTAHKPPFDAFWGQRYAQIEDPDANVIDLFAQL